MVDADTQSSEYRIASSPCPGSSMSFSAPMSSGPTPDPMIVPIMNRVAGTKRVRMPIRVSVTGWKAITGRPPTITWERSSIAKPGSKKIKSWTSADNEGRYHAWANEASRGGINGFFVKFSNVVVFLSIAIVFIGSDWAIFNVETITNATQIGLRSLMVIFPAVFLLIGIIAMSYFPINKERYEKLTGDARKLHSEKKEKVSVV